MRAIGWLFCCTIGLLTIQPGTGLEAAEPGDRHPGLTRLSPAEEVWVDPGRKEVVIGGRIALDSGPIEFFACPEGTKEHESIVATKASARLVHAALLAIGLEPGKPVSFDPEYVAASGPRVRVQVRWTKPDGASDTVDVREWIRDVRTGKPLATDWVFAGSSFWTDPADGKEYYQADGGDLICVSNFPTATLDLPVESSQSNEALLFEAFAGRGPARGTEVELVLSAR
ncbi:MAG: YdjY domain-containing protein [Planctomycetia bacterium]